jgi:glycine/D-amino acid oxidase-like deaminating enzyme/nitrite reductase/ring-hydroxylating ferredoxin subunit
MIQRDGARISLWQDTMTRYEPVPAVRGKKYDVAIAGGGMTGITLALQLQQHGLKCIVLEAQNIGFGTSGGTTAHLNTLLDTPYTQMIKDFGMENARIVASAARAAIQLVRDNIDQYSIDCAFEETPGYLFSQTDDQKKKLEDIYDACIDVGLQVELVGEIPVPLPFNKAMKIPQQARFHPLRYLQGIAAAFEQEGGVIVQHCRVVNCERMKDADRTLSIETSEGNFQAENMVYATHIPTGVNILHLRCPAYRSYAISVRLEDGAYPQGLVYDMHEPYHYFRTHDVDGKSYLIVGGEDHKTGEESNTSGRFLKLESYVRSHFNVLEVTHQWSSQYFEPVDGLPYIGHLPGNPDNVYVATGYSGNGMTYSHVAALLLRSLILGHDSPYSEVFNPGRVKPVAGFTEFVKHNADVVKQFAGKWFGKEELHVLAGLAPGEGKVVKYEDHTLALYKDEAGMLHAVNPACTHMKCAVAWNAAEKSWDCPCHGSRFSYDGQVLTGPADKDLEPAEVRSLEAEEKMK